jgi:hypothetical protein
MKKFSLGILCCLNIFFFQSLIAQNVWTQHNDQARTGWYPYETTLNTNNVNKNTFGLNYSHTTDDKVIAQPLVVMHVNIPGVGFKNIVFVATVNNTIYAYDADVNVAPYWQQNYTGKISTSGPACGNCRPAFYTDIHPSLCYSLYPDFDGNMGIVGTPVIDTANGIMYFVTKIVNPNDGKIDNHTFKPGIFDEYNYTTTGFHQYLHAIDITTGLDKPNSPVEITAIANGTGDGQVPAGSGHIPFEPRRQFNRAGLVLNNGILYIAFAAHCDFNPSHGWVMSFNPSTLGLIKTFIATPNDGRGGIWMSGTAPAVDPSGNLYVTTGNSLNESSTTFSGEVHSFTTSPADPLNRGESVIKLAPDLTLSSFFTPFNYLALNDGDLDFPIQVMLLPNTNLALTGNKDDSLYILDRNSLGGFDPNKNNVKQTVFVSNFCEMHSTFAYFGGTTPLAYQYGENSPLRAYPVSTNGLGAAITNNQILGPTGGTGGFLSVSSNGADPATGILWAYQAINGCDANGTTCQGILHAVNASDIKKELWNSDMNGVPDHIDIFNKMSCPTIALGKVYLAANRTQLRVYGLITNSSCLTNQALNKPATAPSTAGGSSTANVDDGNLGTNWTDGINRDADSIYIDLQGNFNICRIAITWNANGYAQDFDMKVSNDLVNWTTVKSFVGNTVTTTEFDGTVTGRYVSMVASKRGTTNPYSISEFQVFGSPGSSCFAPTNLTASTGSYTTIFTSQTPTGTPALDGGGSVTLGVKFSSASSGFIKGIRFYKTAGYFGTHTGLLYASTGGSPLASAVFTGETASGWQTVLFPSPFAITAGTTYVAAFFDPSAYYVADNNGFAAPISNPPLTAPAVGGVYAYGGTATFPNSKFASSNYWVDPIFSPTATIDSSTAHLSWDAVPGATQYIINYRPSLSASWITRTSTVNELNISALSCGTIYNFTVQTNCGATQSTVSSGSFITPSCPSNSCDIFPVRYFNVDLGDIGRAGSTCIHGNVYTITGSGTDIGGSSDQFQYAFTHGDTQDHDMTARILQQDQVSPNNKIGIMVRDSLSNTSRFAYLASVNNGASFIFEYRTDPASPVTKITLGGHALPYWAKISKIGTTYAAFLSGDGSNWTQVGGPAVNLNFGTDLTNPPYYGMAVTSANNSVLSTGQIDNFSLLGSTPLPIKLISFTAKDINHDHVLVSWATSMEHLVDHFEIERSVDNSGYQTIDKVDAIGESETPHYYSVNDNNPAAGRNFYRLKEIDKDNKFYYSPVVSVNFNATEGLEIYPNPADNYANVTSPKDLILDVRVFDVTGKLMQSIHSETGLSTVRINTSSLPKGVYFVRVKTRSTTYNQKLFRQ